MSKQELYGQVISRVFADGGFVYGGYVRDLLIGAEPNDIDVQVHDPFSFIISLTDFGTVTLLGKEQGRDRYNTNLPIAKLMLISDGFEIKIDISRLTTVHKFDIDVNQLRLKKSGIYLSSRLDMFKVTEHILNRQFECFPGCEAYRREKMLEKGWSEIVNEPQDVVVADLAKKHTIALYGSDTPQKVKVPQEIYDVVAAVYKNCGIIMAIKMLRACTNCGLKEGKDAVEKWAREESWGPSKNIRLVDFYIDNPWVRNSLALAFPDEVALNTVLRGAGMQ